MIKEKWQKELEQLEKRSMYSGDRAEAIKQFLTDLDIIDKEHEEKEKKYEDFKNSHLVLIKDHEESHTIVYLKAVSDYKADLLKWIDENELMTVGQNESTYVDIRTNRIKADDLINYIKEEKK